MKSSFFYFFPRTFPPWDWNTENPHSRGLAWGCLGKVQEASLVSDWEGGTPGNLLLGGLPGRHLLVGDRLGGCPGTDPGGVGRPSEGISGGVIMGGGPLGGISLVTPQRISGPQISYEHPLEDPPEDVLSLKERLYITSFFVFLKKT